MTKAEDSSEWLKRVDDFLADISWDKTWAQMSNLINQAIAAKQRGNARPMAPADVRPHRAAAVVVLISIINKGRSHKEGFKEGLICLTI